MATVIPDTAWVKPPSQITGLDHLAVQATCVSIYSRLLPGITNVTDRPRYYSLYPWLIWALHTHGQKRFDDEFVELFRRGDCLLTLIAEWHAMVGGGFYNDHAIAMVGSDKLIPVAKLINEGGTVRLSEYASRDAGENRYFKSKLGGLGQYYLGTLRDLNVLDGDSSQGVSYTREIGEEIARRVDQTVDTSAFIDVLKNDRVDKASMERLASFCPCRLSDSPAELKFLQELFFVTDRFYDIEALPRRRSLQTILHLSDQLSSDGIAITEDWFRACCYSKALPNGDPWMLPKSVEPNRDRWAIYATNELLSLALQGLFHVVLTEYEQSSLRFYSTKELVNWFWSEAPSAQEVRAELGRGKSFQELLQFSTDQLVSLNLISDPDHEVVRAEQIVKDGRGAGASTNEALSRMLKNGLHVVLALSARIEKAEDPYASFALGAQHLQAYPLNLQALQRHLAETWKGLSLEDWLAWLLTEWGLDAHLRVALRKLNGQSRSTFRIRPSDRGLEVIGVPPAAHTRPRYVQAHRTLRDLGAMEWTADETWKPTELGRRILEMGDDP